VAAGVRRIEALAGEPAWRYIAERDELVRAVARRLQVAPAQVEEKLESVLLQLRQTERERDELRRQLAALQAERLLAQAERVDGVAILTAAVDGVDGDELLAMGDTLRDRLGEGVVVLGTASGGKALFVAMVTPGLVQLGVHAGHIVREAATVAEGGGGGQPHMARAGGKNPAKLADALARAKAVAREQVAAARASR